MLKTRAVVPFFGCTETAGNARLWVRYVVKIGFVGESVTSKDGKEAGVSSA
jgi:hypothetical protein